MNSALEEAIKEAYALAPSGNPHIHTLELRHSSMSEPLYMVQGFQNKILRLETAEDVTFNATAFSFTLPKVEEGGYAELQLTMDDIHSIASDFCESAMNFPEPIEIYYRPYLTSDPTTPQMDPPLRLFLLDVTIAGGQVAGRAVPVDFLNTSFPSEVYTRYEFPGLGS